MPNLSVSAPAPQGAALVLPPGSSQSLPTTGYLRQRHVLKLIPVSRSTLWRWVKARLFPAPIKLSERVTAWRAEDIRRWIAEHGAASETT